ncbi:MAG: LamG-like jellyroll fold domain-containing protein [Desulfovibrionaceae bacterium]
MFTPRHNTADQGGSTLIFLVVVLILLAGLTTAAVSMFSSTEQNTARPNCAAQAELLAESGLRYAQAELRPLSDLTDVQTRIAQLTSSQRTNTLSDGSSFTFVSIGQPYQIGNTGPYYLHVVSRGSSCAGLDPATAQVSETFILGITGDDEIAFEDGDTGDFKETGEGGTSGPAGPDGGAAVNVDPENNVIELGGDTAEQFGCVWYGGDDGTCTNGNCTLGSGFRTYFEFELQPGSEADGFTFSLISAANNKATACGGSIGTSMGELLGYGGTGVAGEGIAPPKMALEIDIYRNSGSGRTCQSNSRRDSQTRDHAAFVYWGRAVNQGGCDEAFDDNRHGEGLLTDAEPRNPGDWSESGDGFDGFFYKTANWIREWNNSLPNNHRRFRVRMELNRSLEANDLGFYCYTLSAWIKRDNEPMPANFEDTSTDYYDPANAATAPDITDAIVLNQVHHTDMEHIFFGWTEATGGSKQLATIGRFRLAFKPDPVPCPEVQVPQDFVSHWSMYEGSGDRLHDLNATNHNDGQISDAWWVAGVGCPACSGLLMDPINGGQAEIPHDNSLNLSPAGSLSCWVYMNDFTPWGGIIHKGENTFFNPFTGIFFDESYSLQFTDDRDSPSIMLIRNNNFKTEVKATTSMQRDQWYHLAATWNTNAGADELELYVNGVREGSVNSAQQPRTRNSSLTIGAQFGDGNYAFDGIVDEVYIYDRQLSAAEVQALYQAGLRQP